jgi:hypothetical protein
MKEKTVNSLTPSKKTRTNKYVCMLLTIDVVAPLIFYKKERYQHDRQLYITITHRAQSVTLTMGCAAAVATPSI